MLIEVRFVDQKESQRNSTAGLAAPSCQSELILREKHPLNLEAPMSSLESFITPTSNFYVRNHFDVPEIDAQEWKLSVAGDVERELSLTLEEILSMPQRKVVCTMECAGNSRIFLNGAKGLQWAAGAIGTAEWTGVPLLEVLNLAGIKSSAIEVVLEGADSGIPCDEPAITKPISFARSLTMEEALNADVLLAHSMNGEPLSALHGYPLRVIVPGYYGMASVKWLKSIHVSDSPFRGFYQSTDYAFLNTTHADGTRVAIKHSQVKSMLLHPHAGEVLKRGARYRVLGVAWAKGLIEKVEVSVDEEKSWAPARLLGDTLPNCWRFFEFDWSVPDVPGHRKISSRAFDSAGNAQPFEHDNDAGSYVINFVVPVAVTVE